MNPGSVGQPRDSDTKASYAVLDAENHSVELNRVEYDINSVIEEIEKVSLPKETGRRLKEGW